MLKFTPKKNLKFKKTLAKIQFFSIFTSKKENNPESLNYLELVNNFESKIKNK